MLIFYVYCLILISVVVSKKLNIIYDEMKCHVIHFF